mmetsp:Transcript_19264/g.39838  ORF Transcript_19264/g.39838 Transcript_19264/m.39838 type:complete len:230 (+) Transcript_19264:140-829(+)
MRKVTNRKVSPRPLLLPVLLLLVALNASPRPMCFIIHPHCHPLDASWRESPSMKQKNNACWTSPIYAVVKRKWYLFRPRQRHADPWRCPTAKLLRLPRGNHRNLLKSTSDLALNQSYFKSQICQIWSWHQFGENLWLLESRWRCPFFHINHPFISNDEPIHRPLHLCRHHQLPNGAAKVKTCPTKWEQSCPVSGSLWAKTKNSLLEQQIASLSQSSWKNPFFAMANSPS